MVSSENRENEKIISRARERAKGIVRKVGRGLMRERAKPEDERRQGSAACRQPVVGGREHPKTKREKRIPVAWFDEVRRGSFV